MLASAGPLPQKLYLPLIIESEYHYEAINVEAQRANPNSLWYSIKRLICHPSAVPGPLAWAALTCCTLLTARCWPSFAAMRMRPFLVVANLSRFLQTVELDLADYEGQECP